ncbi:hypothetical protein AA637_13920 [Cyanobacterium sp. HL-69]|uniref:Uncharacterized protein n=1 Tax=Cyanobacterium stanieri LEGE 03274 TaxID=1828756 RepID=A0ABR9V5J9_9CHRO|nr:MULTISPECIES: hypothetical protein [Cyanobacterium]AUC62174.1 hypothetical protein AA637_13920 [Cyanobacterium sp. HL-69]MBE9223166.1 hypothetical protein [Cyanobacterium stanieri LEGE 03274]OEJ79880.1 hypothetical protein A5482_08445 [Cyanobacterium sp. IPPAS B-1200]
MNLNSNIPHPSAKEDVSDYVAHLQLHMSLQSRNLLPSMNKIKDNNHNFVYESQATIEKFTSRELG